MAWLKSFILSVSPGHSLSFWQCLREEKILSPTLGGQKVFRRCWGGSEVGQNSEVRGDFCPGPPKLLTPPCRSWLFQPFARDAAPRGQVPSRSAGARCWVLTAARFPAPALPHGNRAPALRPRSPGSPAAARPSFLTLRGFAMLGGAGVDQQDEQAEPGHAPRAHGWSHRRPGGRGRSRSPGRAEAGRAPARQRGEGRGRPAGAGRGAADAGRGPRCPRREAPDAAGFSRPDAGESEAESATRLGAPGANDGGETRPLRTGLC